VKNLTNILYLLVIALLVIGTVLVFSASSSVSISKGKDLSMFFTSHVWKVVVAFFLMIIFSYIPYEIYLKYSKYLLLGSVVLLILTLLVGWSAKGAVRWLAIGGVRFQPSELARLILIIHIAGMVFRKGEKIKSFKNGLIYPLIWIFVIAGLVMLQPNVSMSVIIVLTSFTVLYVGGARLNQLTSILFTLSVVGGSLMLMISHSRQRIFDFANSFLNGGEINHQVLQSKIAMGSGGVFGIGLGASRQSDLFLPESFGDFIFSILGEETGFVGAFVVLAFYLAIFVIGLIIAKRNKSGYAQLLAFGLTFNLVLSAFINIAVVTGIIPTTGITLPFISFGGTSLWLSAISIGIIVNIGLETHKRRIMRLATG